ncbi:YhbY family RNA-binding protein [Candidatus Woesearchaeota archaeon]|nr:YhbY family RNA-binding protein [Candidatus Woesearchaeota archaeon]
MNLKQEAKLLEPVLRIGKFGLTTSVLSEIEKLLKKKKLIKVKILKNCIQDKEEIIDKVISRTNSELISKIGNVFVVYRR